MRSRRSGGMSLQVRTGVGVYLTTNNGANWTQDGLMNNLVQTFAVNGTELFAGTNDSGVYLTTNNGTSWTAVNNGLTNWNVQTLVMSGTNLFSGTYDSGVYLSTNDGASWNNVGLSNSNVQSLAVSGSNLFAGTTEGVFISTNNGVSWTEVDNGLPASRIMLIPLEWRVRMYLLQLMTAAFSGQQIAVQTGHRRMQVWSIALLFLASV